MAVNWLAATLRPRRDNIWANVVGSAPRRLLLNLRTCMLVRDPNSSGKDVSLFPPSSSVARFDFVKFG